MSWKTRRNQRANEELKTRVLLNAFKGVMGHSEMELVWIALNQLHREWDNYVSEKVPRSEPYRFVVPLPRRQALALDRPSQFSLSWFGPVGTGGADTYNCAKQIVKRYVGGRKLLRCLVLIEQYTAALRRSR